MFFSKIISTFLGVGYIKKGGGTVAAAITAFLWYWIATAMGFGGRNDILFQCTVITVVFFLGVWGGDKVEKIWGKDSYRVVLDEVLGMCISLFLIPVKWQTVLAALVLFRIFDIAKPFYIRRMENFPGGWGVMLDDVLAGVYANIVLLMVLALHWL
ncbi:MAG TPA: phosphatidylglycerophosphatase A [Arachidicoccus sp.]